MSPASINFSATDHAMMARALRLAGRGAYTTRPNPMVGCVIARKDKVLGEGYHVRAGEPHAEVFALRQAGYMVVEASDGAAALATFERELPDLVILDVNLPVMSGFEVCRRIRAEATTPVMMLTVRSSEEDQVRGLDDGADDYLTKPFSPRELVARVGALLRRARPAIAGERLGYADLEMDLVAHRVKRGGETVALGPTEFRLLRHFLERPGRVFSRERLLDAVWGHDSDIELRTVDVHIRRLRKAINANGRADIIRTVRSAGYALDADGVKIDRAMNGRPHVRLVDDEELFRLEMGAHLGRQIGKTPHAFEQMHGGVTQDAEPAAGHDLHMGLVARADGGVFAIAEEGEIVLVQPFEEDARLVEMRIEMDRVGRDHHVTAARLDAHALQPFRMPADMMHGDARRNLVGAVVKRDASGVDVAHHRDDVVLFV